MYVPLPRRCQKATDEPQVNIKIFREKEVMETWKSEKTRGVNAYVLLQLTDCKMSQDDHQRNPDETLKKRSSYRKGGSRYDVDLERKRNKLGIMMQI